MRLTIDEAINMANQFYGIDPLKIGKSVYKKSYIYNLISKGKLKNHGPRHMALLDEREFRKVLLRK
ncbi:MAG: hypothetical protein ACK5RO_11020 [Pseudobdellovibrionaceae bacterium]|jgi:hypothetical protein|nr:hypothetical protein [Pseudanabaena sp. M151S2SP2A07QC]